MSIYSSKQRLSSKKTTKAAKAARRFSSDTVGGDDVLGDVCWRPPSARWSTMSWSFGNSWSSFGVPVDGNKNSIVEKSATSDLGKLT